MQLLLFLSALLAGLTGAFSGDRAVRLSGQHGEAAITRAAEAIAESAIAAVEVQPAGPFLAAIPMMLKAFAIHSAPRMLPARLTTGRRLE